MVDITTDEHFANVVLTITDIAGNPAKVDGVPIWASSDETVLRPVVHPSGMGGAIETVGPGIARITVSADADLGSGVSTITGVSDDINVIQGILPAALMRLDLGPPSPK